MCIHTVLRSLGQGGPSPRDQRAKHPPKLAVAAAVLLLLLRAHCCLPAAVHWSDWGEGYSHPLRGVLSVSLAYSWREALSLWGIPGREHGCGLLRAEGGLGGLPDPEQGVEYLKKVSAPILRKRCTACIPLSIFAAL